MQRTFSRRSLTVTVAAASILLSSLAALPAVAKPASADIAKPASANMAKPASAKLDALAHAFYVARASFDPLYLATANGDGRYDDKLGITINPDKRKKQFATYRKMQAQLRAIPRAQLNDEAQLNFDLLAFDLDSTLNYEQFPEHLLPINQMDNVPSTLANYAGGTGSQPLSTVKQYGAYLARLNRLPTWVDQAIANMREGMRTGVVHPKSITTAMLPQFRQLQSDTPEANIFYTPIKNLPAQFSSADKQKLTAAYRHTIATKLMPSMAKLVQFLEKEYLPAGRTSTGLSQLPNGAAWYQARIKDNTTTTLSPEQIHQLGLKEVARIEQQMAEVGPKLGYTGPSNGLAAWVAEQAKFMPFKTDKEVLDAYRALDVKVSGKLQALFSLQPKAQLELQLEPELSRATASDHYTPSSADGSHPGVFWAVVNDPTKYDSPGMTTLYLHEGKPGHHFHAALLKEITLPDFRKFNTENSNSAAFTEGWALYAETLGKELGLYEDPAAYFGHLNDEMLRAVRLVVDTGMHAKGWTREQSIAYMREHLGYSEAAAQNQTERYMVLPAQALSYKIGALKIQELRARAEQALGPKFSLPKFHAVVIGTGTLPMPILEARIDRWIAASK
jgi:uncharacterized protein (DUF885 family)